QNIKHFSAAVSDAQAVTAELRQRKAMIADAQKALQDIDATSQQITKLAASADDMLNGDGRRTLKNVADAAEEAKSTPPQAHAMIVKLQGPTQDFSNQL